MAEEQDFTLMLFSRNLTAYYDFLIKTLEEASRLIYSKNNNFDQIAIIEIAILQSLLQYIETVGAYCLACQKDGRKEFTKVILNYRVKDVHDFYSRLDNISDKELNYILSFCAPSYWTSTTNQTQIEKRIEISKKQLRKKLQELGQFWNKYHDFYNASKHGGRYWMYEAKCRKKENKYIGIQWLNRGAGIGTILEDVDKLKSIILRHTKIAERIMTTLHHNRILIWSSDGKIDPNRYQFIVEK